MNKLQQARAKLLLSQPFFGTLVIQTPLIENRDIPTAATDMKVIYYNPDFFEELSIPKIMFVLVHEVLHIAFLHGLRKQGRHGQVWNIAADYAINWICKESDLDLVDGICLDGKYANMSAEAIYDRLIQEAQSKPKPQPGDGEGAGQPGDGAQSGAGDQEGQGPGQPGNGVPQGYGTRPGDGMGPDLMDPGDMTSAERARAEQDIRSRVAQAATMAKMAGKLPGSMARYIDEIINPPVHWHDVLRDHMLRVVRDDESWARRNRRFRSMYLPARHSEKMGEIVVIGDTSGSVGKEELAKIAGVINGVADQVQPERIRVIWADTEVAHEQTFELDEPLDLEPKGYGGTDMRVPLRHAEQYDPCVVLMITDAYTPWPTSEPPFPLIVCCTTEKDVPIGDVIRI